MKKWMLMCGMCAFLSGCNYSVIMNATHGQASDLVDETDTASPDVSPTVTIPMAPVIP